MAFVESEANHTNVYLKDLQLDSLKEFTLTKQQVLACVGDNALSMSRTVQLLNKVEENDDNELEEEECEGAELTGFARVHVANYFIGQHPLSTNMHQNKVNFNPLYY